MSSQQQQQPQRPPYQQQIIIKQSGSVNTTTRTARCSDTRNRSSSSSNRNRSSSSNRSRIRFASSKQRSKQVSADVYRHYKRQFETAEERVHHQQHQHEHQQRPNKRLRYDGSKSKSSSSSSSSVRKVEEKRAVLRSKQDTDADADADASASVLQQHQHQQQGHDINRVDSDNDNANNDDEKDLNSNRNNNNNNSSSTFAEELDLAMDRNASEIFGKFYRQVWPLVRSLPEILHYALQIMQLCNEYVLSPADRPEEKSDGLSKINTCTADSNTTTTKEEEDDAATTQHFIPNHATMDILHLWTVLARDLRHEIHPFVHTVICPRLLGDLLNPPAIARTIVTTRTTTTTTISSSSLMGEQQQQRQQQQQQQPLDVSLVEAAFRTIAYVFRYDSAMLLNETAVAEGDTNNNKKETSCCLEHLRQYYGKTLAHKREVIRRLAAETFAPLIRQLKRDAAMKKHIRRVLRALALSTTKQTNHTATATAAAARLQADAVDGIAQLLFQTAKGVRGQLHSKGHVVIAVVLECVAGHKMGSLSDGNNNNNNNNNNAINRSVIQLVASSFLDRLCQHLEYSQAATHILVPLIAATYKSLQEHSQSSSSNNNNNNDTIHSQHLVELVSQVVFFRKGAVLVANQNALSQTIHLLKDLFQTQSFLKQPQTLQAVIMQLLSSTWRVLQNDRLLCDQLGDLIQAVLVADNEKYSNEDEGENDDDDDRDKSLFAHLMQDLLPFLPIQTAMSGLGSSILSAAAKLSRDEKRVNGAIDMLYSLASVRFMSEGGQHSEQVDDTDELFDLSNAQHCEVSKSVKEDLLQVCVCHCSKDSISGGLSSDIVKQLAIVAKATAFASSISISGKEGSSYDSYKPASKHLLSILNLLMSNEREDTKKWSSHHIVSVAMVVECIVQMTSQVLSHSQYSSVALNTLKKMRPHVHQLLKQQPQSLWTVKCTATFTMLLQKVDLTLSDDKNDIFELLVQNLHHDNHFYRLHSLEILCSFPKMPFVVDHAELDLSEDLDEETESNPLQQSSSTSKGPCGVCNLMDILLAIERTPAYFSKERYVTLMVSRVEVLGRSGKLPVSYAEAAANHMLGLLYTPFLPVWTASVKALVALSKGHEMSVWPPAQEQLSSLMSTFPYQEDQTASPETPSHSRSTYDPSYYYDLCVEWEKSNGKNTAIFSEDIKNASLVGRVSRHRSTDEATVLESLWKVFEEAPQLLLSHSRRMVPIFIHFLHSQYYYMHPEDPDARELRLSEHVGNLSLPTTGNVLSRGLVMRRLASILKAFSSVNGPQQLFKHKVLFQIYLSLLSHPDSSIAESALSCTLRYKPEYLMPYADYLQKLFAKGKLREALLDFRTADEGGVIVREHRSRFMPVLSRILFGRLSARSIGARSSKDTPSARRSAILSFLSSVSKEEGDLYPFIYLMTRPYIPSAYTTKPIELHETGSDRTSWVSLVENLQQDECRKLPTQVHQGFMNTLEAVIAHLGRRIEDFVPALLSIVLIVSRVYEVNNCEDETVDDDDVSEARGDDTRLERAGIVRNLCFRRLADLFCTYSNRIEFDRYATELWSAVETSLSLLPTMAVHAEKAPSLLLLLRSLSTTPELLSLLAKSDAAVPAVLKCFARGSKASVVDASLVFISNLLCNGDEEAASQTEIGQVAVEGEGVALVKNHLGLLIKQFRDRLDGGGESQHFSATWRRELTILCRVSSLIDEGKQKGCDEVRGNAQVLCTLLIPFLSYSKGCADTDKLNVLRILVALFPMISSGNAPEHYIKLAKLLGPVKAKAGITSKPVRASLSGAIDTLARSSYHEARDAAGVLVKLCATSEKRVDEIDFDEVIPALGDLSDPSKQKSWSQLCCVKNRCDPSILLPLIHCCFHLLFCEDGVVARSSFRSLRTLVEIASEKCSNQSSESDQMVEMWTKLLEGCIVPLARTGLNVRDPAVRRYFILIIRDVAKWNKDDSSPNLHGDLADLVRDEDPDLDFFTNITHVQIHRRARALQRLRKALVASTETSRFSPQSLSHILLPLALHPIYEVSSKAEESVALEGIATAGAISRLLSWSKYNNVLWTTVTQFHRHPEQETYLVGLLCALLDGFHFTVDRDENVSVEDSSTSAVWRALEKRFIPRIEGLLIKEKVDNSGDKVKTLRPSIVLAMVKLFKKLPEDTFKHKLPRILAVICDALKSRDSDSRDVARTTLAKIAVEIEIDYLPDIVRELAVTLTEGYQLHVRSAALHSVLLKLSEHYKPPSDPKFESKLPPFDAAIPALMDLVQQDLFGMAQERKNVNDGNVRYVKEAGGSKSTHSIELIASMVLFQPSIAKNISDRSQTSIHALVNPLLQRLRSPGLDSRTLRQIKDCLSRIVTGLQRNCSVTNVEILPFAFATLELFVGQQEIEQVVEDTEDSDNDDNDLDPVRVSGGKIDPQKASQRSVAGRGSVVEWRPSALGAPKTAKEAQKAKRFENTELKRVKDGASAPKLTGSRRYGQVRHSMGVNDPATISAVWFGLQLLGNCLKKTSKFPDSKVMLDPFVPLLTACVCQCHDSEVVLLSLKCLGWLLRSELPSLSRCAKSLAVKTLDLLTSSGAAANTNQELLQASFKMLTYLINYDCKYLTSETPTSPVEQSENAVSHSFALPLDAEQMNILLSFLKGSLVDADHHNPAMSLVKAIMSRHYISAEFYDLIETLLELSVRSSKPSLREQSSALIVSFLINYPLSEEKLEQHLQKIVLNLKYEYADGRMATIGLVTSILDKFPTPLIEKHCQLFFLPLTLQLVNDESKGCREAVAACISKLFRRLPTASLQSLFDYTERWSNGSTELQRLALQLYGIFIESQPEFIKRGETVKNLSCRMEMLLHNENNDWEIVYFTLLSFEKMLDAFPKLVAKHFDIWESLVPCMTNQHAWIKLISTRILSKHLSSLDPRSFAGASSSSPATFLAKRPGQLYQVARNLCFQLGADEESQTDDLVPFIVKSLTWTLQAMHRYPELCFDRSQNKISLGGDGDDDEDEVDGDPTLEKKKSDPVLWLMTRLSNIARPRGTKRRQAVFKCFAAFATFAGDIVFLNEHHSRQQEQEQQDEQQQQTQYLELMLTPLHRAATEHTSRQKGSLAAALYATNKTPTIKEEELEEMQLVQDVLHLLEEKSPDDYDDGNGAALFVSAYAAVKKRATNRKEQRKVAEKVEYTTDPQRAAQRRVEKQEREKKRRKRRVDERRTLRGGVAKRRHL